MPPPQKPPADACCGTGCAVCVFDVYLQELERHLTEQAQQNVLAEAASQAYVARATSDPDRNASST